MLAENNVINSINHRQKGIRRETIDNFAHRRHPPKLRLGYSYLHSVRSLYWLSILPLRMSTPFEIHIGFGLNCKAVDS